jgi:hypothetical protein
LLGHRGWSSEDANISRVLHTGDFPSGGRPHIGLVIVQDSLSFGIVHMPVLSTELRERSQFRLNRRGWDPMARLPLFIVATLVPLLSKHARTPDQRDLPKQLTLSQPKTITPSNNVDLRETQSPLNEVGHKDSIRPFPTTSQRGNVSPAFFACGAVAHRKKVVDKIDFKEQIWQAKC